MRSINAVHLPQIGFREILHDACWSHFHISMFFTDQVVNDDVVFVPLNVSVVGVWLDPSRGRGGEQSSCQGGQDVWEEVCWERRGGRNPLSGPDQSFDLDQRGRLPQLHRLEDNNNRVWVVIEEQLLGDQQQQQKLTLTTF